MSAGVIPKQCKLLKDMRSAMRLIAGCAGIEVYKEATFRLKEYLFSLSCWGGNLLSLPMTWSELLT